METPGKIFKRATVEAAGFTLDYAEAGPTAPKAVIVSLPGSAGLEMSVAKDALARTYRVIEINPPGWGGKDDLDRPITQQELGKILAEAIAKLVDGPFYLIGTSMGGTNALWVTEALPDRVLGIVHEGSMAPSRGEDLQRQTTPEERAEMERAQKQAEAEGRPPVYPTMPAHPKKPWSTPDYVHQQMANRFKMFRWLQADLEAAAAMDVVRNRKIPVLALLGDEDEILKVSQRDAYAATLPHARFEVIPGGRHDLQNTTPEAFTSQVEGFITQTARADR